MAYSIKANMNLNNNEIQNVVIDKQESVPGTGVAARLVYVTADNKLYYYNGTQYVALTTSESGEYQLVSEKDQANGYAGLDAGGKIVIGELPTGVGVDTIPVLKGAITNGQSLRYDSTVGGFVSYDISSVYSFKGSCSSTDLEAKTATAQSGDVWNLTDSRSWNGGTYPAGTNWAFESTGAGAGNWEPLTGIIDLSGYQTTGNMVQTLDGADTTHYPSAKATSDAIAVVAAVANAAVVANGAITGGTYTKITFDAKGLVTGGANLVAGDIPDLSASYVAIGRIGAASGVAGLGSDSKVPLAQLPTGNGENLIPVLPSAGTAGQALVVNEDGDGFTFRTVPDHSLSVVPFTITGDGSAATFNQAINFDGQMPSAVTIFDANGNIVFADVQCTTSQVTVTMSPPPQNGENYRVRIIG